MIVSDNFHNTLSGTNINKLTIANIHFKRDKVLNCPLVSFINIITFNLLIKVTTTQGHVTAIGTGFVDIRIEKEKYPDVKDIFNNQSLSGRYIS